MSVRPRFRLPVWGALLIVGGAYLFRSAVLREGDFSLDVPSDVIVLIALAAAIGLVALARFRQRGGHGADDVRDDDSAV